MAFTRTLVAQLRSTVNTPMQRLNSTTRVFSRDVKFIDMNVNLNLRVSAKIKAKTNAVKLTPKNTLALRVTCYLIIQMSVASASTLFVEKFHSQACAY